MKLPLTFVRLVEHVSDEKDIFGLINQMRDGQHNKVVNTWPQVIVTTDATLTSIWNDDLPADSVGDFWLEVISSTSAAGSIAGYKRRLVAYRVGSSAVAYLGGGADTIGTDKESVLAWDVAFALDATTPGTLYASVTGAAATTISWRAHVTGIVYPWS